MPVGLRLRMDALVLRRFATNLQAHPFKISPGMTVVDLMDEMELAGFTVHAM